MQREEKIWSVYLKKKNIDVSWEVTENWDEVAYTTPPPREMGNEGYSPDRQVQLYVSP